VGGSSDYATALAELAVGLGANVQPDQIVAVSSEPGMEELVRAVADVAYARGAKFVDLVVFDPYVKHSRMKHAALETLPYVPPWFGQRVLALGEAHAANIALVGPSAPRLMADIDPDRLGLDMLPRLRETGEIVAKRLLNWSIVPSPTPGWAAIVFPDLDPEPALERLWEQVAHVCRLDEADPVQAWSARLDRLAEVSARLNEMRLDALHFEGPGTNLTIGLLPGSRWISGQMTNVDNIVHTANIPTEEVFTAPDPTRVDGTVTSTKPLFSSGTIITGLRVRFEGGRAVEIEAEQGGGTLRTLTSRDEGAARLGEVALVDRESRIGKLGTVFYTTLLDENAASHLALGRGYADSVEGDDNLARLNLSEIHIDFMVGADDVAVTGRLAGGEEVPLLRGGAWQV
jgi:aminopeptidase